MVAAAAARWAKVPGLGAAERWRSGKSVHKLLIGVEIVLMSFGMLAVPYVLFIDRLRGELVGALGLIEQPFFDGLFAVAFQLPIVLIGILSGLELPLLMKCAKDARDRGATSPAASGVFQADILAWDYVGTVLGAPSLGHCCFLLFCCPCLGSLVFLLSLF